LESISRFKKPEPLEAIVAFVQEEADVQEEEHLAYFTARWLDVDAVYVNSM